MARTSLPPWPNSAMDGYAIRAADTTAAGEGAAVRAPRRHRRGAGRRRARRHRATGHGGPDRDRRAAPRRRRCRRPGRGDDAARRGRAARPARPRRDRPAAGRHLVHEAVAPGGSVRTTGSDLSAGTTLVEPGTAIGAATVALLAGAGVEAIVVHRRPRVAVLATGDEVRAPGRTARAGRHPRRERARPAGARRRRPAARPIDLGIATDDPRRRAGPAASRPRPRRGRAHRLGRRLGRAVRRRQDRDRDHRPHRPVAGRRPAGQAVRVRDRGRGPAAARRSCCSACPATRSRRAVTFELFVRPRSGAWPVAATCSDPSIGRSSARPSPRATAGGRSCASSPSATPTARRSRDERGRVRVRPGGRAGEPRHLGARRRRRPRRHPRGRRRASRPAPRSSCGGSTGA